MGWLAIMPFALDSETWGVKAPFLLQSASHEKNQFLPRSQENLCGLAVLILRFLRLRQNYYEKRLSKSNA
jgi:hypothetical protein